jgi:hypothetical protein
LWAATRGASWVGVQQASQASGADVCRLAPISTAITGKPWSIAPTGERRDVPRRPIDGTGGPLDGITVLEAGRRIQAPLAAHLLRLLGARVIRIEPPGGDPMRGMPPACGDISAAWLALNRGKEVAEIDIKKSGGQAEVRDLAASADIFMHNWAPGKAEHFSLDSPALAEVNPSLIYAHTSGWGGRIPDAPTGTDFMVQARTGLAEAVQPEDELPAPSMMTLTDVLGGLQGAQALLATLLLRERSHRGAWVESSLLGAAETLMSGFGSRRRPRGFRRPLRVADGYLALTDSSARALSQRATDVAGKITAMTIGEAIDRLREQGLTAVPVTTDLTDFITQPRMREALTRDEYGAAVVPSPWNFD